MTRSSLLGLVVCALLGLGGCTMDPAHASESRTFGGKADRSSETPTGGALAFEDASLQCFDGEVEIGIYSDGPWHEPWYGEMIPIDPAPGHVVKIRTADGETIVFDQNVFGTTDGAGNDTIQVLSVTQYGLRIALDLYYDHEEGFLRGHYALPTYYEPEADDPTAAPAFKGFSAPIPVDETMNCYDYTYGDL